MESVTVRIKSNSRKGKYLIALLKDLAKDGNEIEFEHLPNAETQISIDEARDKKGFKAKNIKDLFQQLEK